MTGGLPAAFAVGGGGERFVGEMRRGVSEVVAPGGVDEMRPLALDGLADGFSLAGDYLVENLGLVCLKPVGLLVFDGERRHVGDEVAADVGEVVVLGDEEDEVVSVFAVGAGGAALFAVQLGDYVFVPLAVAPVEVGGGDYAEMNGVPQVGGAVGAAGVHDDGEPVFDLAGGAVVVFGANGVSEGVFDLVDVETAYVLVDHAADVGLAGESLAAPAGGFVEEEGAARVFGEGGARHGGVGIVGGNDGGYGSGFVYAVDAFGGEAGEQDDAGDSARDLGSDAPSRASFADDVGGDGGGDALVTQPGDEVVVQAADGHVGVVGVNERGASELAAGYDVRHHADRAANALEVAVGEQPVLDEVDEVGVEGVGGGETVFGVPRRRGLGAWRFRRRRARFRRGRLRPSSGRGAGAEWRRRSSLADGVISCETRASSDAILSMISCTRASVRKASCPCSGVVVTRTVRGLASMAWARAAIARWTLAALTSRAPC